MMRIRSHFALSFAAFAFTMLGALLLGVATPSTAADTRDVVRDARGAVVVNTFGHCVRTQWNSGRDECGEIGNTVYFQFNKATLTPQARKKLDGLVAKLKGADVKEIRIVGYADRIGNTTYNEKLSQRRAKAVKDYLARKGVAKTNVTDVRWLGESVPATSCPNNLSRAELIECLQPDRRVEIEIETK